MRCVGGADSVHDQRRATWHRAQRTGSQPMTRPRAARRTKGPRRAQTTAAGARFRAHACRYASRPRRGPARQSETPIRAPGNRRQVCAAALILLQRRCWQHSVWRRVPTPRSPRDRRALVALRGPRGPTPWIQPDREAAPRGESSFNDKKKSIPMQYHRTANDFGSTRNALCIANAPRATSPTQVSGSYTHRDWDSLWRFQESWLQSYDVMRIGARLISSLSCVITDAPPNSFAPAATAPSVVILRP